MCSEIYDHPPEENNREDENSGSKPSRNNQKADDSIQKILDFLENEGVYYNLFSQRVRIGDKDLNDKSLNTLTIDMISKGIISKSDKLLPMLMYSEYVRQHNPVTEVLKGAACSYEPKDSQLDMFLSSLHLADKDRTEFLKQMIVKWMLQIPAVALDSEVPRLVLVLIGPSYIGKSTTLSELLPPSLAEFYAEIVMEKGKDNELVMTEKLLLNLDEFEGLVKTNPGLFKQRTSQKSFYLRRPFRAANEHIARRSVLCGTSNTKEVISDKTAANTRIIPIDLSKIDKKMIRSIDKVKLWGEITRNYLELGPQSIQMNENEVQLLADLSLDYRTESHKYAIIKDLIIPSEEFTPSYTLIEYLESKFGKRITTKELASLMSTALSISPTKKRIAYGGNVRGYYCKIVN